MRVIGWIIIILLIAFFGWYVFLMPIAVNKIRYGVHNYIATIPISSPVSEMMQQKIASYDENWNFIPPRVELTNVKIKGQQGEWNEVFYLEPEITVDSIMLEPIPMMRESIPIVKKIGNMNFKAQLSYRSIANMLEKRNPNFKVSLIGKTGKNQVEIIGVLSEVHSEVTLTGNFKVNIDGQLEFTVNEITNFLHEKVRDAPKRDKVLNALDLKWEFNVMGRKLDVNRAATNRPGVYIECSSEIEQPVKDITNPPPGA